MISATQVNASAAIDPPAGCQTVAPRVLQLAMRVTCPRRGCQLAGASFGGHGCIILHLSQPTLSPNPVWERKRQRGQRLLGLPTVADLHLLASGQAYRCKVKPFYQKEPKRSTSNQSEFHSTSLNCSSQFDGMAAKYKEKDGASPAGRCRDTHHWKLHEITSTIEDHGNCQFSGFLAA